jgi:hypothetical protein
MGEYVISLFEKIVVAVASLVVMAWELAKCADSTAAREI